MVEGSYPSHRYQTVAEAKELIGGGLIADGQQLLGQILSLGSTFVIGEQRAAAVELVWSYITQIREPLEDHERLALVDKGEAALNFYAEAGGVTEEARALNARAAAGYGELVLAKVFYEPDPIKKDLLLRSAYDIMNKVKQPRAERAFVSTVILNTTAHKVIDELLTLPANRRDPELYGSKKFRAERLLSLMERRGETQTPRALKYLSSSAVATWALGLAAGGVAGLDWLLEAVEIYDKIFALHQNQEHGIPSWVRTDRESLSRDIKKLKKQKNTVES